MIRKSIALGLACLALTSAAFAQGSGGGAGAGGGAASSSAATGGTGQGSSSSAGAGHGTGGIDQTTTYGGINEPLTNSLSGKTTGSALTNSIAPVESPSAAQAQRNMGAGTAPNGLPIGSSGSGIGSPEHPVNGSQ